MTARRVGSGTWLALMPLLVGTFTATVNNAVVNVPMARILIDFRVPLDRGALVVVGFNLTFAVLMPLSGWLGDKVGRRRLFCFAMSVLALGAVGSALAPNLLVLVIFRMLQGAATAAVLPGVMSLIASMFAVDQRGRALGVWAAVNGAGQATGPAMGGLLATWLGWRSIFWPTVPLSLLALVMTLRLVPKDTPGRVRLEWRGGVLLTVAAGLCLGAASSVAPLGLTSPFVWVGLVMGVLAALGYLLVERGRADAFLPPRLLLEPRYLHSSIAVVAQMFCLGATLLGVPLYLVQGHGTTTATAGLLVLSMPLTMAVLAPLAGLATERLSPRVAMRFGLATIALGQAGLSVLLWGNRGPDALMAATLVVVGAGVAFVQTPAAAAATRSQAGQLGAGLGLFNLLRFGGSALGASWVASVAERGSVYGLVFLVCTVVGLLGLAGSFVRHDVGPQAPATGQRPSELSARS